MIAPLQSLQHGLIILAVAVLVIGVAGTRMSALADRLADRTGWGEALFGGILLAAATSLPDFAATLTAARDHHPELAVSNMMGSIGVNLAFLGIADVAYRKANLEHAAASSASLSQGALLIVLLGIPLLVMLVPEVSISGVHPATLVIILAYLAGFQLVRHAHTNPMWLPRMTPQTRVDQPAPDTPPGETLSSLWVSFAVLAAVVTLAGWATMKAAEVVAIRTPLSESQVGIYVTALFTSVPELVVTIAAVRQGALTLAFGNILGTNCLNVVVIAAADIAYRDGSIYHAVSTQPAAWGMLSILMTGILLLGFVRRERFGVGRIGFESLLILLMYGGALIALFLGT